MHTVGYTDGQPCIIDFKIKYLTYLYIFGNYLKFTYISTRLIFIVFYMYILNIEL